MLEAYELGRVLGRREMFAKPMASSVLRPVLLQMEDSVWKQKMVQYVPSVGKHEVHYVDAVGYWLILLDISQNLSYDEETDAEGMVRCLAFSVVF